MTRADGMRQVAEFNAAGRGPEPAYRAELAWVAAALEARVGG
ncbi:hypothetical protein ABT121_07720 [Streptomyces sp. NPDC001928]